MRLLRLFIIFLAILSLTLIGQKGMAAPVGNGDQSIAPAANSFVAKTKSRTLTRVTLRSPQSIDTVASALRDRKLAFLGREEAPGQRPQVIEIRHSVNGHTGGLYPGGAYKKTLQSYKKAIKRETGAEPRITSFAISGDATQVNLGSLQSLVKSRKIVNQVPRNAARSPKKHIASPYDQYWQPWESAVHLTNGGAAPRNFRYDFGWRNDADIDKGFGDRNAFELDVKLYNSAYENIATRPGCVDAGIPNFNTGYWAARSENPPPQVSLSTGGPLYWDTTIPGTAYPYFDYADYTDDCGVIDFSAGVTYPNGYGVQPDCDANGNCIDMRYHFYIGAAAGLESGSNYTVFMQKLTNNCPAQPPDPSSCVGLNNTSEARTHTMVPANTWSAPDCVMGYLDFSRDPQAPTGTTMYDPATHFNPGTWLPGWQDSGDNRYYCG